MYCVINDFWMTAVDSKHAMCRDAITNLSLKPVYADLRLTIFYLDLKGLVRVCRLIEPAHDSPWNLLRLVDICLSKGP